MRLPDDRFDVAVCCCHAGYARWLLAVVFYENGMVVDVMALHSHTKKQKAAIRKSRKSKVKGRAKKQNKKR